MSIQAEVVARLVTDIFENAKQVEDALNEAFTTGNALGYMDGFHEAVEACKPRPLTPEELAKPDTLHSFQGSNSDPSMINCYILAQVAAGPDIFDPMIEELHP